MAPEVFERLGPVVHGFQLLWVEAIHALPAALVHGNDADLKQNAEMLGHARLRKSQGDNQRANGDRAAPRQQFDNLPPPRFGDGVENVGCRSGSWHVYIIFPYGNMSRAADHYLGNQGRPDSTESRPRRVS